MASLDGALVVGWVLACHRGSGLWSSNKLVTIRCKETFGWENALSYRTFLFSYFYFIFLVSVAHFDINFFHPE